MENRGKHFHVILKYQLSETKKMIGCKANVAKMVEFIPQKMIASYRVLKVFVLFPKKYFMPSVLLS